MAAPRFWSEIEAFRDKYTRRQALPWTHAVNHRLGVLITLLLGRMAITPNMVTVAGLMLYAPIALLVASLKSPVGAWPAVVVLLGWQLAFTLDCADGQLARVRGGGTPFGAWLDQILDFLGHVSVITSLVIFLSRALSLDATAAILLVSFAAGANLLLLFAAAERTLLLGSEPAVARSRSPWVEVLTRGRYLTDYGFFLFLAAGLLAFPRALLWLLLLHAGVASLTVLGQLGLNWRSQDLPRKSPAE